MMIVGLLLTGCGSETEVLEPTSNLREMEQERAATKESDINEVTDKEKITDSPTVELENNDSQETVDEININLLSLNKETICYEEWGNYGVICQSARDIIHLEDETKKAYPELSKSLDTLRDEKIEEMDWFMGKFLKQAQEEDGVNEEFYGYTNECEFFVQRADNQIQVYELTENGGIYQGGLERAYIPGEWNSETDSYFMDVWNDLSEFELQSRIDWVGVVTGEKTYMVDWDNPLPKAQTDYYDISTDWYTLTLKKPLEMKILPNGKMEEIPAGTTFQYLRTDGETYVDLLMEDGRECRVMTENWDGEPTINGNYPEMYFEGLPTGF